MRFVFFSGLETQMQVPRGGCEVCGAWGHSQGSEYKVAGVSIEYFLRWQEPDVVVEEPRPPVASVSFFGGYGHRA